MFNRYPQTHKRPTCREDQWGACVPPFRPRKSVTRKLPQAGCTLQHFFVVTGYVSGLLPSPYLFQRTTPKHGCPANAQAQQFYQQGAARAPGAAHKAASQGVGDEGPATTNTKAVQLACGREAVWAAAPRQTSACRLASPRSPVCRHGAGLLSPFRPPVWVSHHQDRRQPCSRLIQRIPTAPRASWVGLGAVRIGKLRQGRSGAGMKNLAGC